MRRFCREDNQASLKGGRLEGREVRWGWTRQCPCCGRTLHKSDPMSVWVCECGWKSG